VAALRPPKRVHLPSGLVVDLAVKPGLSPRARAKGAPLFSELVELLRAGDVRLSSGGRDLEAGALELRDFHALRAIATRLGWLEEAPVEIACRNCEGVLRHAPCASFELGPFVDGELHDPELDVTLDLSVPHPVPPIPLRSGRPAADVRLRSVTVAEAAPLHRALRRRRFVLSDRVVVAMGIEAVGPLRDPRRIADVLSACSDEAWGAVGDLFLAAHYPVRLASVVRCTACGARNDVDAPYERELEPSRIDAPSNAEVFPDFDAFARTARDAYRRIAGPRHAEVRLVVDAEVPACDDGGEPLMGAYLPPAGEPGAAVGNGEITLYYRTFRSMWDEEPFDWKAEIDETLEHELEHHDGWRVGHDAMDDDERAEIVRENVRVVGRKAVARESLGSLGADLRGFLSRTWPIWLIVAAVTVAVTTCNR
jgi:hypothetical protein